MRTTPTAVSALALLTMATPASAADLASMKDPVSYTAGVQAPTWTGLILGVGVDGQFVNHDIKDTFLGFTQETNGYSGVGPGADFLVGFRYQFPSSRLVFGIEAEYDITDAPFAVSATGFDGGNIDLTGRWGIFGTAGVVINPWTMAYVGGGYGQAFFHSSGTLREFGNPTVDGAVFKAGLEAKLPFIAQGAFMRGEYEYFAGNQITLATYKDGDLNLGGLTDTANINTAKLVLGYQFGTGSTPLEAFK